MSAIHSSCRRFPRAGGPVALLLLAAALPLQSQAAWPWKVFRHHACGDGACGPADGGGDVGGAWYWLRSPEQERRVVISHYNRYCVRCHGVDGRGVWDIPDVPDFTNARWQASRSDDQLVRATLEGRGAVMPPFRGTLTLEEAWSMARYLRTFIPGTEQPRPDKGPEPAKAPEQLPDPMRK